MKKIIILCIKCYVDKYSLAEHLSLRCSSPLFLGCSHPPSCSCSCYQFLNCKHLQSLCSSSPLFLNPLQQFPVPALVELQLSPILVLQQPTEPELQFSLCCWSRADLLCPLIQPLGRPPRPNLSVGLALGLWLCLRPSLSLSALLNNEINECQIGTNSKVNVELALPLSQRVWSTGAVEKGAGNKCVPTTAYLWTERDGCLNLPLISFMAH